MQGVPGFLASTLLARAQATEILRCLRAQLAPKANDDAADRLRVDGDVEEALGSDHVLQIRTFLFTLHEEALGRGHEAIVGIPILLLGILVQPKHSTLLVVHALVEHVVRLLGIHLVQHSVVEHHAALLVVATELQGPLLAGKDNVLRGHIVRDGHIHDHGLGVLRQRPVKARAMDGVPIQGQVAVEYPAWHHRLSPRRRPPPPALGPQRNRGERHGRGRGGGEAAAEGRGERLAALPRVRAPEPWQGAGGRGRQLGRRRRGGGAAGQLACFGR
mmetsp:Transcript_80686/g.227029  ORF Transcript_80686/g.227029 Transcript_80686/m.227029 type:complete len:274 (-) Transcript_80686:84-905(-)